MPLEYLLGKVLELAGITDLDDFKLRAGYEILAEPRWSCSACLKSTTPDLRLAKGCKGITRYTVGKYLVIGCVGNHYDPRVSDLYRAFRAFQVGALPFEGGMMDQPAKILEAFSVFESLEAERAERDRKKLEKPDGRRK